MNWTRTQYRKMNPGSNPNRKYRAKVPKLRKKIVMRRRSGITIIQCSQRDAGRL
jgi:hypothetical protein